MSDEVTEDLRCTRCRVHTRFGAAVQIAAKAALSGKDERLCRARCWLAECAERERKEG